MQKNNDNGKNKNKNAPTPVYKPYLRGNMFSGLAMKRGLRVFGIMAAFAFFGLLASGVFSFDSGILRVVMNGALLFFGAMLMFSEGSRFGEADVTFAEIALKHQEEGKEVTKKDRDTCYHPGKGFVSLGCRALRARTRSARRWRITMRPRPPGWRIICAWRSAWCCSLI